MSGDQGAWDGSPRAPASQAPRGQSLPFLLPHRHQLGAPSESASWLTLCPSSGGNINPVWGCAGESTGPGTAEGLLCAKPELSPAHSMPASTPLDPRQRPEGQTQSGQRASPRPEAKLAG